ncbi:uncharacterized protein LOC120545307 [Perca fluviatilis]|uniref:uncharacterized protein LOC120545307 n=1 Tax=Perca fluviatilis TaxID=8168 RepID=UPI0019635541|nr:uncharacterized protein LOC120545307 [Perca fluviatilis]
MNKLKYHAASFIREFDSREQKMRQIIREFRKIADEVRKMQETTDEVRRVGTGVLGVTALGTPLGLLAGGAGVVAAESTALALAAGGARVAAAGAAGAAGAAVIAAVGTIGAGLAAGSAILVAGVNVTKGRLESVSINKVEELGKDFMEMVEPLKKNLKEIKRTCEKLEKRSTELQTGITLIDMLEFQRSLSELVRRGVLSAMWNIFTITATPEEDRKLTDSIIQSADRCQKVIDELEKMKEELKDFTEQ